MVRLFEVQLFQVGAIPFTGLRLLLDGVNNRQIGFFNPIYFIKRYEICTFVFTEPRQIK